MLRKGVYDHGWFRPHRGTQAAPRFPMPRASKIQQLNNHFFRTSVVQLTLDQSKLFTGKVQIDENYFGARRVLGNRGRGADEKIQAVGT